MSDAIPMDGGANGIRHPAADTADVLELKLPLSPSYLPLVRASAGIIAGGMSFNYDEIVQIRVAAGEAFELTMLRAGGAAQQPTKAELLVRFRVGQDRLEIFIPMPEEAGEGVRGNARKDGSYPDELESETLMGSLMDEVDLRGETVGAPSICLVKYRKAD